ncbi:MAG: YunC family protein [archaeon]
MHREILEVENGAVLGYNIDLGKANLLLIEADLGYICCSYFDPDTIEKLEDAAVIISGVKRLNEMMEKKPSYISTKARELGIDKDMNGRQCLNKLIRIDKKEPDLDELIKEGEEPDEVQIQG